MDQHLVLDYECHVALPCFGQFLLLTVYVFGLFECHFCHVAIGTLSYVQSVGVTVHSGGLIVAPVDEHLVGQVVVIGELHHRRVSLEEDQGLQGLHFHPLALQYVVYPEVVEHLEVVVSPVEHEVVVTLSLDGLLVVALYQRQHTLLPVPGADDLAFLLGELDVMHPSLLDDDAYSE